MESRFDRVVFWVLSVGLVVVGLLLTAQPLWHHNDPNPFVPVTAGPMAVLSGTLMIYALMESARRVRILCAAK